MDLFGKVRVLIGALVHRPFEPRRAAKAPEDTEKAPVLSKVTGALEAGREEEPPPDAERVADLIARKRRDPGG